MPRVEGARLGLPARPVRGPNQTGARFTVCYSPTGSFQCIAEHYEDDPHKFNSAFNELAVMRAVSPIPNSVLMPKSAGSGAWNPGR